MIISHELFHLTIFIKTKNFIHKFPFETKLEFLISRFFWKGGNSSVELDSFKVPNFKVLGHQLSETQVELKTGNS